MAYVMYFGRDVTRYSDALNTFRRLFCPLSIFAISRESGFLCGSDVFCLVCSCLRSTHAYAIYALSIVCRTVHNTYGAIPICTYALAHAHAHVYMVFYSRHLNRASPPLPLLCCMLRATGWSKRIYIRPETDDFCRQL